MAKIHVNDDGEYGDCGANKGKCPYGSERHFDTEEEAAAFATQELEEKYDKGSTVSRLNRSGKIDAERFSDFSESEKFEVEEYLSAKSRNEFFDRSLSMLGRERELLRSHTKATTAYFDNLKEAVKNDYIADYEKHYTKNDVVNKNMELVRRTPSTSYGHISQQLNEIKDKDDSSSYMESLKNKYGKKNFDPSLSRNIVNTGDVKDKDEKEMMENRLLAARHLEREGVKMADNAEEVSKVCRTTGDRLMKQNSVREGRKAIELADSMQSHAKQFRANSEVAGKEADGIESQMSSTTFVDKHPSGKDHFGQPYDACKKTQESVAKSSRNITNREMILSDEEFSDLTNAHQQDSNSPEREKVVRRIAKRTGGYTTSSKMYEAVEVDDFYEADRIKKQYRNIVKNPQKYKYAEAEKMAVREKFDNHRKHNKMVVEHWDRKSQEVKTMETTLSDVARRAQSK